MNWYVLTTKPQKEFDARDQLRRDGLNPFLPYKVEYRLPNDKCKRKRERHFPLMTGYIFLGFDQLPVHWYFVLTKYRDVLNTVLSHNGEPCRISDQAMAEVMKNSHTKAPDSWKRMRTKKEFNVGEQVEILKGPFRDFSGFVEEITEKHVIALVELMGRQVPVEIDPWDLAKAS